MNMLNRMKVTLITLISCLSVIAHLDAFAHSNWRVTSHFQDRSLFQSTISHLDANHYDIDGLAVNANGEWILISEDNVWASGGFNSAVKAAVTNYVGSGHRVVAADCNENNACIVVYDNWGVHRVGVIPQILRDKITGYKNNSWSIRDIEMTDDGYVILGEGSRASYANVDQDLRAAIYDRRKSGRTIDNVEIGFNGEWALLADHNPMYENVHPTVASRLDNIGKNSARIDQFVIGIGSNYLAYSGGSFSASTGSPMDEIEFGLGNGNSTNIWQRMDELNVSGLSVAIIESGSSHPKVTFARGYGRKKSDEQKPVLAKTPFKLASLSKYIGGMLTLDQIESDNSVQFNTDITSVCSNCELGSWQDIGESAFGPLFGVPTNNLGSGITLERLMSHTAGINNFSTRIAQSSWSTAKNKKTSSWLLGMTCSNGICNGLGQASTWRTMPAGNQYQYSNGGFLIAQAYLEDQYNDTINDILDTRLFGPIGMNSSSGDLELSDNFVKRVAWQHNSIGPRSALTQSVARLAGGVWSSGADYAEAMIVALNRGRNSKGVRILNTESVTEMLSTQPNSSYGWGVNMDTTVTESNDQDFFHNGANGGRVYTYMCGNPTRDEGIVILLNTESDDARTLAREIRQAYLRAVSWPASRTCS